MPSPSPEIIQLLSVFSVAFTAPTFAKVMVPIFGTILAHRRPHQTIPRLIQFAELTHFRHTHVGVADDFRPLEADDSPRRSLLSFP